MDYKSKYLKYKSKYLELKNQQINGGKWSVDNDDEEKITMFEKFKLLLNRGAINQADEKKRIEELENARTKRLANIQKKLDIYNGELIYNGHVYKNSNLTKVTIPTEFQYIEHEAFTNNKLTTVKIPDKVIWIGNKAFANNQLTTITIPKSVRWIGDEAFANNELTTVNMLSSIEYIGKNAFANNNQLTAVNIYLMIGSKDNNEIKPEIKKKFTDVFGPNISINYKTLEYN